MTPVVQRGVAQTSRVDPALIASGYQAEFLRYRTDTKGIISDLYKYLAAVDWDPVNKRWVRFPGRDPLCPDPFLTRIMTVMSAFVNHNTMHSNLKEQEVHDIVFSVCEEIVWLIVQCGDKYGVKEENYSLILRIIENTVFLTLSRAKDDGERNHEDNSYKNTETTSSNTIESGARSHWFGR